MNMRGQFHDTITVREFLLAGNARVTLVSKLTGARFTFRVRRPTKKSPHFVALLRGPDNEADYEFIGSLLPGFAGDELIYRHSWKSRVTENAPAVNAFSWFWRRMREGKFPRSLEVWHEGRCGRCGRLLTVPESVGRGFGPECIGHIRQSDMFADGISQWDDLS